METDDPPQDQAGTSGKGSPAMLVNAARRPRSGKLSPAREGGSGSKTEMRSAALAVGVCGQSLAEQGSRVRARGARL